MKDNNEQKSYTAIDISRYLNGSMTASEMHDIERSSLQDPFLADAIEGYRKTDAATAARHLNEITALLQNHKQPAQVIVMPKRRNYTWQIAASIIAVISISIFFLYQQPETKKLSSLAINKAIPEQKKDSITNQTITPVTPLLPDSLSAVASNLPSSAKRENTTPEKYKSYTKKEITEPINNTPPLPEASVAAATASPKINDSNNLNLAMTISPKPSPAVTDSQNEPVTVANSLDRKVRIYHSNSWTNDKGKPFILSEVEEVNLGRKTKQKTDTAVVKPEGGWQSFQDYLFTKLSKKDTSDFINATRFDGDLEFEFSLTENGSPYNVKVLSAPDSAAAKTAAAAVQQGPKWITAGKKEKRLNIRY